MHFIDYAHQVFAENTTSSLVEITGLPRAEIHSIRQALTKDYQAAENAAKRVGAVLKREMLELLAFSQADINSYIRARNVVGIKPILN